MPVPKRIWKEVSIDFITNLPKSNSYINLIVVIDRLSKDVVLIGLEDIAIDSIAKAYINYVVAYY